MDWRDITLLILSSTEEAIKEIESQHSIHQKWEFADRVVTAIKANITEDMATQILSGNKTLTKCLIFIVDYDSMDKDGTYINRQEKMIEKVKEFFLN